jgi:zinc D-Ala-D-Ala dipeptidase
MATIHPVTTGRLGEFRSRPLTVEVKLSLERKPAYRKYPIDAANRLYGEGCVDVRNLGVKGENYYHCISNPPYFQSIEGSVGALNLRETVAKKLAAINAEIAAFGIELWVFDAWRLIAVQNYFHDRWMPDYLTKLNPFLVGDDLRREVEMYWAPGAPDGRIDPLSPPPHATGGAVDLTLRWLHGGHLYMGSIFDDVTQRANTAFYEDVAPGMSFSDIDARDNRRMLYWLMASHGFCNNPTEWWHFS